MEVMPGYKQSVAGMIPDDWEVASLALVCSDLMQNGVFYQPSRKGKGVKLINVGDLYKGSPIHVDSLELFDATESEIDRFRVKDGDLFFTRSSVVPSGIAFCNIYSCSSTESVVFDSQVIRVRPDIRKIVPSFLFRFCISSVARIYLVSHSKTGTMTTIDQEVLGKCPVLLPTLAEQEAIAEALGDADALIESLEQLIAKKRLVKQGAMQELLTGKRRLPGFSKEWRKCKLADVGGFSKGRGIKKDDVTPDGLPCIRYGEIYTHYNDFIDGFISFIPPNVAKQSQRIFKGDLLFTGSGETAEEIGKCVAFLGDEEAYAGGDIVIFKPEDQRTLFLAYLMNSSSIAIQKARWGQGDAVVHISSSNLGRLEFSLPPVEEQIAIAEIILAMDTEIKTLEEKLEKARKIKQGMMQELLTGRIRLV